MNPKMQNSSLQTEINGKLGEVLVADDSPLYYLWAKHIDEKFPLVRSVIFSRLMDDAEKKEDDDG